MLRKLLVAVAFDDLAGAVEDQARELARAAGAECILLHVVEAIGSADDPEMRDFLERLEQEAVEKLREPAERLRASGVPCTATVAVGRSWQVIAETAESEDVDLVVVGSRPTVIGGRPHLGSTSHQVFFSSPRSLLVVRG
jgi:nucleotide-binding universal stress UspA family protein